MNQGPLLFLGIFFSMALSFGGLILGPHFKIGRQQDVFVEAANTLYPADRAGLAEEGAQVYRSLGCVECHTQQVRGLGSDRKRGWGARITVAQDYLGDYPVMLGNLRVGPDLANVGPRQPDTKQLLLHIYNPKLVVPKSTMPPYRFLFEKRKIKPTGPSPEALPIKIEGYEIVPTHRATALVAYLQSLNATIPLFEAPLPPEMRPKPADTNAPSATATNAAATNVAPATN